LAGVVSERLLTVAEVAERLALKPWAIRGAIGRGELAAFKVCGRLRVTESAVDAFLDASSVQPAPATPRARLAAVPAPPVRRERTASSFAPVRRKAG
jgi:excisionase family DNA binding protein